MRFLLPILALSALAAFPTYAADKSDVVAGEPATLDAENIVVNDETGVISASGNVEARAGERILRSGSLTYNRNAATMSVPEGVSLREADGSVLEALSAEIDNRLERGSFKGVRFTGDGVRLRGKEARRNDQQLNLDGAVFTSCPACEEDPDAAPLWQIRASNIHYDRAAQNVSYRHARLEVFGLPSFYLPYLAHAGPQVDKRSGVLTPSIGSSGDFGSYVEVPYLLDLAPNYDLTLTPRISAEQDPFLTAEWRHLTHTGSYQATGYIHQPQEDLTHGEKETRGGLLADGRFQIGAWDYGFNIQQASDRYFYKDYRIFDPARLTSSLTAGRRIGRHNISFAAYRFDDTIANESVNAMVPRIAHSYSFKNRLFGGQLSLSNVFTQQERDSDVDTAHLSSLLNWSWRHVSNGGFVWSARHQLALDAFDFEIKEGDREAVNAEEAETFLSANSLALTLAYPLQRITDFDRQTLSPQIQLVLAEADDDYKGIPFLGTATRNLSQSQLFQPLAAKDEASRVNLGLNHQLELGPRLSTVFFIGQSYNLSDETYAAASGYAATSDEDRSAILTNTGLYAGPLSLSHEARFSDDGGDLLRGETRFGLAFQKLELGIDHSFYEAGQQGSTVLEEATTRLGWQIGQNWRFDGKLLENLETKTRVRTDAAFTYEDDCTIFAITFDRDETATKPETGIKLNFTLKTIGG